MKQEIPQNDMDGVICRSLSTAYPQAKAAQEPADEPVTIIKKYPRPEFSHKPTVEDTDRADRVELMYLRGEVKRLNDKICRLEREIHDEIHMLTKAANDGVEETLEQVRRRISRLKGSLDYIGREL